MKNKIELFDDYAKCYITDKCFFLLDLDDAKDEWELYKSLERNTANIDYIAMMSDIEIEEDEEDE